MKSTKYNYKFFQNKNCEFYPCHKIAKQSDFNCLFCYCPLYSLGDKCGGNVKFLDNGIKDCSECSLPHIKDNYDLIIDRTNIIVDKIRINNEGYKIKKILIATTNNNKVKEIKNMFAEFKHIKILSLNDIDTKIIVPKETKNTFKENSILKAQYYSKKTGLVVIADDSGLMIKYLDDFPGIKSARWLKNKSYEHKNKQLIDLVNKKCKNKRQAKFVCAITFCDDSIKFHRTFFGEWRGHIAKTIKGTNGFGYDPIFIANKHKKSAAELPQEIKNTHSHRGVAMLGLKAWLKFFS